MGRAGGAGAIGGVGEVDARLQMRRVIITRRDLHVVGGMEEGGYLVENQVIPCGQGDARGAGEGNLPGRVCDGGEQGYLISRGKRGSWI